MTTRVDGKPLRGPPFVIELHRLWTTADNALVEVQLCNVRERRQEGGKEGAARFEAVGRSRAQNRKRRVRWSKQG